MLFRSLVTTCEISNATPAAFSAHTANRKNTEDILEQEVYNGLSVVFSGGYKFLAGKNRKDNEDLAAELLNQGYTYITTRKDFDALKTGTAGESPLVWGLFAPVDLAYDIDRDSAAEPSLEEMTEKAIRLLSADKDGFFLMVEGSKIDWAAHANEPACLAREIIAFDRAVRQALAFAKSRDDTIVIVASDHGTGGVTIGDKSTASGYDTISLETFIAPLRMAKKSGAVFASLVKEDRSNLEEVLANVYGIKGLTEEERELVKTTKLDAYNGMILIGKLLSGRARLGFTTAGHTGDEVCLCLYAPTGSPRLGGTVQNSDIAWYISDMLGLKLKECAKLLYQDAETIARATGATAETDLADLANPVLVLRKSGTELRFPVNKNYCLGEGAKRQLSGVTVYIPETKSWYVASDAAAYLGK